MLGLECAPRRDSDLDEIPDLRAVLEDGAGAELAEGADFAAGADADAGADDGEGFDDGVGADVDVDSIQVRSGAMMVTPASCAAEDAVALRLAARARSRRELTPRTSEGSAAEQRDAAFFIRIGSTSVR